MKLIWIFGPQAIGKMTVGQELARITDLKLFHNHMTIDFVSQLFDLNSDKDKELWKNLSDEIRTLVFKYFSLSNQTGLIFTTVRRFDVPESWEYTEKMTSIFRNAGAEIIYIELEASLEERLKRNITENRLNNKITKRNTDWTKNDILNYHQKYRLNSHEGEIKEKNYLKINNSNLTAEEVAIIIKNEFSL